MRLSWRSQLLASAGALLSACGDDSSPAQPIDAAVAVDAGGGGPDAFSLEVPADRAALFELGPYTIGYRTATVTYRPEGTGADRSLKLDLWYPGVAGTGDPTVYRVAGLVEVARTGPRTNAAVLAQGRFPVIVYSHGSGGVGLAGFSYGEYFASWGFVVAAPDHTGNTALDPSNPIVLDFLLRPQDLSATLDWVTGAADSPVKERTTSDVAAMGHSFGGYGVLSLLGAHGDWSAIAAGCPDLPDPASCAILADPVARAKLDDGFNDPRFELAVAQTPVVLTFAPGELAALERPVMMMTAHRDQTLPWDIHGGPGWAMFQGPEDTWIDIDNAGHYSVVAVCDVVSPVILAAVGLDVTVDGCGPDFTPIAEIMPVVTAYAHAFVRLRSLGESRWAAVIAGETFHPQVTVTVGAD